MYEFIVMLEEVSYNILQLYGNTFCFLLYSPVIAINVGKTCNCDILYSICCVGELLIGFIEPRFVTFTQTAVCRNNLSTVILKQSNCGNNIIFQTPNTQNCMFLFCATQQTSPSVCHSITNHRNQKSLSKWTGTFRGKEIFPKWRYKHHVWIKVETMCKSFYRKCHLYFNCTVLISNSIQMWDLLTEILTQSWSDMGA